MSYFTESETINGIVTDLALPGITVDDWGSLQVADDVTAEDLAVFGTRMFRAGLRAQRITEDLYASLEYERNVSKKIATIFGEMAKAAAIDQRWCNEYEGWTEKIGQALTAAGFYSQSQNFKEASERREKFNVTVTVLANGANSAYDWRYAVEEALRERGSSQNYGVDVVEFSEVNRVLTVTDEDPNGEDVTY
jgi:hypothetical protein